MGIFITFEGIEGCGKSTQLEMVAAALRLRKHEIVVSREPGGTKIGDAIRLILLNPEYKEMAAEAEILLYGASRAQHVVEVIRPALDSGKIVLVDRFADSTTAYQGAARQLGNDQLAEVDAIATGGLTPDATFLLDIPVNISRERLGTRGDAQDRLEQESLDFHERVRLGYLRLAEDNPHRIVVLDGTGEIETIHQEIMKRMAALTNNRFSFIG